MPFTVKNCHNGFYWIHYTGKVDLQLRLAALQTVEAAARQTPIYGNIIDFREADLVCSFTEQFQFAKTATESPEHRGRKSAYLVRDKGLAPIEILELALCNRGIQTRVFTEASEAITWITNGCYKTCEQFRKNCCPFSDISDMRPGGSATT